nr:hypothetical protein [Coxiella endosymbiont of Ornithodoros amblus]
MNELIYLGTKRFLRIGTAGSLQPQWIKTGDVVIATEAAWDEYTSSCYVDIGYSALLPFYVMQPFQELRRH